MEGDVQNIALRCVIVSAGVEVMIQNSTPCVKSSFPLHLAFETWPAIVAN